MARKRRNRRPGNAAASKMPGANGFVDNGARLLGSRRAVDAYTNLAANLGFGSNNVSNTGGYVMDRISWDYMTLNILYRNNWIAKAIIDKPANEMMKNGFQIHSQIEPDKIDKVMAAWTRTKSRKKFLDCIKWARLYGGCILVPLLEGQEDLSEPLDFEMIMPGSYKGCFLVDRWSGVSPSVELVTDISDPDFGTPEYYDVSDNTTDRTIRMHHSRIIKMNGRMLPYWEEIAENYFGASELEHVFTELRKRDDTSANIAFLIFLANIRVYKMEGYAQAVTMGDQEAAQQMFNTMRTMNRLMCNTGTACIDREDDFQMHQYSFTGINDVYQSFMMDISGAAEIPVDKLFGRTQGGWESGKETLQNYYDTLQEKQESELRPYLERLLKIITMSELGEIPDDFELVFNPIRRPSDLEKSDLAVKLSEPIMSAWSMGLIDKAVALRELRTQSDISGLWSNITDEMINDAMEEDKRKDQEEEENQRELFAMAETMTQGKEGLEGMKNAAAETTEETPGERRTRRPSEFA